MLGTTELSPAQGWDGYPSVEVALDEVLGYLERFGERFQLIGEHAK